MSDSPVGGIEAVALFGVEEIEDSLCDIRIL